MVRNNRRKKDIIAARQELVDMGLLRDSGHRTIQLGREQIIWDVVPEVRAAYEKQRQQFPDQSSQSALQEVFARFAQTEGKP